MCSVQSMMPINVYSHDSNMLPWLLFCQLAYVQFICHKLKFKNAFRVPCVQMHKIHVKTKHLTCHPVVLFLSSLLIMFKITDACRLLYLPKLYMCAWCTYILSLYIVTWC